MVTGFINASQRRHKGCNATANGACRQRGLIGLDRFFMMTPILYRIKLSHDEGKRSHQRDKRLTICYH